MFENNSHIVLAFEEPDGKKCYEYKNAFEQPAMRALHALDFYNDMERKIDNKQTAEIFRAILKELNNQEGNKIIVNVFKIGELCSNAIDKLEWPINIDLVWRLASVLYFDESEDITNYDPEYGEEKIKRWKKNIGITEMVKKKSLRSFFPWLDKLDLDLENFSILQKKADALLQKKISGQKDGRLQKTGSI